MDTSKIVINTVAPVYISLTTIPPRLENTVKIIKNTLLNLSGFQKLIINIPRSYVNFSCDTSSFKKSIRDLESITDTRLVLNRPTNDNGPLTKLVSTLDIIPSRCILIVCDDDCYHLETYKIAAEAQDLDHTSSFTFWKYKYNNSIEVPQGADMITFWKPNMYGFNLFLNGLSHSPSDPSPSDPSACFYVDDLVIGKFLQDSRIPIKTLDRKWKWPFIPSCFGSEKSEKSEKSESLFGKTGPNSRDNSMRKCFMMLSM